MTSVTMTAIPAKVSYGLGRESFDQFEPLVGELIRSTGARRVLDIGGGAKPFLGLDEVEQLGLDYTVLDISAEELRRGPGGYRTVVADIAGSAIPDVGRFDLAFSQFLAEHVHDGEQFHRNVRSLLEPGGLAVHYFPTLFAPQFFFNRLVPERLSQSVLVRIHPDRKVDDGIRKFPAHYRWCRGPGRRQVARLRTVGFEVVEYRGFFGYNYFGLHPAMERVEERLASMLVRRPIPSLTAFAIVVLRAV